MDARGWDARYRAADLVWSAGPNVFVADLCAELPPGRAIDLAAGEGRNTLWLAERGWDATAVDFSEVAIGKALEIAERRHVSIEGVVADLDEYVPTPTGYDLVLVAYLQLADERLEPILRRAGAAVAPGGTFLLVNHDAANLEHGHGGPQDAAVLTTPAQVVAALGDGFTVERAEVARRVVSTDAGERTARDTVVLARRDV